jgi:hypothetical protein
VICAQKCDVCKGVGNNVFRGVIGALSRDMCSKVRCVQGCGGMDWALSRECVRGEWVDISALGVVVGCWG